MRVHCVPLITLSKPLVDSNWVVFRNLTTQMVKRGWTPFVWFPSHMKEDVDEAGGPEKLFPGRIVKYYDASGDWYIETNRMPEELIRKYSRRSKELNDVADLVITSRAGGAFVSACGMADFRTKYGEVPHVIFEALVRDADMASQMFPDARSFAYATVHTWFLSDAEKKAAMSMMSKVVAPAKIVEAEKRMKVIGIGVNVEKLDKVIESTKRSDKFTVFFGARFSKDKRPDLMYEIMSLFFEFGRPVHCIVDTQHVGSKEMVKFEKLFSFSQFQAGCPQAEFHAHAASSHVFICTSDNEGWPSGVWEQLYLTQVGIFPDKPWVRANLPKWYPFVYKNMDEAHAMIRWIYQNHDAALKKVAGIREYIREKEAEDVVANSLLGWFSEIVSQYREAAKVPAVLRDEMPKVIKAMREKGVKQFTIFEVSKALEKFTALNEGRFSVARFGSPSFWHIYVWLEQCKEIRQVPGIEPVSYEWCT